MKLRLSYYPDITQHRSPQEIHDAVRVFARSWQESLVQSGTAAEIEVLPVVSVRDQTRMIASGECEIGLLKPSSYVYARRRNANVSPAAVALRVIDGKPGDIYFAQIYANTASGIRTWEQLQQRCAAPKAVDRPAIGFGDPFSTANFIVPAAYLLERGLHPLTRFRTVRFCGGHDGVVEAVYKGDLDIGAGHDGVIVDLARQPGFGDAAEKLVRLERVFIHSDPVAINVIPDLQPKLIAGLMAIQGRDEVKRALDIFWGAVVGLAPTRHENYASVEKAIDRLGIPESDILE